MKLLRLKITDLGGFRSLSCGFEHHFRNEWSLQEELAQPEGIAPFICAGPNGSGKSNLLEVLGAIFFQLEILRVRRVFLPALFNFDPQDNPHGIQDKDGKPNGYELEYLVKLPIESLPESQRYAHVSVIKKVDSSPQIYWLNASKFGALGEAISSDGLCTERERDFLLPEYVVGYSSGENEILSLPFFKMRFVQFDEYWKFLKDQLPYRGRPETRMVYLDSNFSQAILLCNLLMHEDALQPFKEHVGVETLNEFRIILRRSIAVTADVIEAFGKDHPALMIDFDTDEYRVNLLHLLEANHKSAKNFDPIVTRLKRCASCWYEDIVTDTLVLDYRINDATREAFRDNFDYEFHQSPLGLFQALQVLLTLNLYQVSNQLKNDIYHSNSHYVSETVPTLASDQRIMRIKNFYFTKQNVPKPMLLKELSDGEYQLLHSLGLCLLFRNTNSLFLLDEPETHFNPNWRANFISQLRQCLPPETNENVDQEMLITTHTPFLISDSKPDKILVFNKNNTTGTVNISQPDYNTLGASINKIMMSKVFEKRETIGRHAQTLLDDLRKRFEEGDENREILITEINQQLGDSVEKLLLIKAILDGDEPKNGDIQD